MNYKLQILAKVQHQVQVNVKQSRDIVESQITAAAFPLSHLYVMKPILLCHAFKVQPQHGCLHQTQRGEVPPGL